MPPEGPTAGRLTSRRRPKKTEEQRREQHDHHGHHHDDENRYLDGVPETREDDEANKGHSMADLAYQAVFPEQGLDIFFGVGDYFSWTFSILSALLGVFVLFNLNQVAAIVAGHEVQLKVGEAVIYEFNA